MTAYFCLFENRWKRKQKTNSSQIVADRHLSFAVLCRVIQDPTCVSGKCRRERQSHQSVCCVVLCCVVHALTIPTEHGGHIGIGRNGVVEITIRKANLQVRQNNILGPDSHCRVVYLSGIAISTDNCCRTPKGQLPAASAEPLTAGVLLSEKLTNHGTMIYGNNWSP
jgi:hypothetical protein